MITKLLELLIEQNNTIEKEKELLERMPRTMESVCELARLVGKGQMIDVIAQFIKENQ